MRVTGRKTSWRASRYRLQSHRVCPKRVFFCLCLILVICGACGGQTHGTIGAILARESGGQTYVRDVPEHLAAYEAGVRPGDELLFIEGQDVRAMNDDQLRRLLHGVIGQEVQLTLARGRDQILRVSVARSAAERYLAP